MITHTKVIENYEAQHGKDGLSAGLKALQHASLEAERANSFRLSDQAVGRIAALAEKAGCLPEELVERFTLQITANGGDGAAAVAEFLPYLAGGRGSKMALPTVGIIVALEVEFDAMRFMLENGRRERIDGPGGGREFYLGEIPSTRKGLHQIILAQTTDMGNTSAALRASRMLENYHGLEGIIVCGIAGAVPNPHDQQEHVRLGDIVVSNRMGVIQYDFGKQKGEIFEHRHPPRPPSARLLEAVRILEQDKLTGDRPWEAYLDRGLASRSYKRPDASTEMMLDEHGSPIEHPTGPRHSPEVFLGPIASSNSVQGDFKKRDALRDRFRVKAIEMEGSGIADATWEYEVSGYLVVRGTCDYCDHRTKHLQTDAWKPYASMVAAAYVRALLEVIPA